MRNGATLDHSPSGVCETRSSQDTSTSSWQRVRVGCVAELAFPGSCLWRTWYFSAGSWIQLQPTTSQSTMKLRALEMQMNDSFFHWALNHSLFVGWLLNIPATCECISGTDLHRQFYVLPHWDRSCRSNFPSHPVTVYWHRADQSHCWPYNARRLAG